MACFSGQVEPRSTKMFARLDGVGNQYIVYSVEYSAATDVAVIFPLPIAPGDASVQFVSFDGYEDFFYDLASGFVAPSTGRWIQGMSDCGESGMARVRRREAMYAASIDDLNALDPAIRPNGQLWDRLSHYQDFGFVVIKLPSTAVSLSAIRSSAAAGRPEWAHSPVAPPCAESASTELVERVQLSPVAFRFASREPRCVYFPLITVLDGEYHPVAEFDHTLYLQHDKLGNDFARHHIGHVSLRASNFMRPTEGGVVCPRSCCFRRIMRGQANNLDLWVHPPNAAARIARWQRPRP